MKHEVQVLGKTVATLEKTGVNKCVLSYDSHAEENDFVSLTMPVRTESWVWENGLHPFFQMNLPEGFLLKVLQDRVSPMVNDPVFLLGVVGENMIGRVKVLSGTGPEGKFQPKDFNLEEFLSTEDSAALFLDLVQEHSVSGVSGVIPKFLDDFQSQHKSTIYSRRHIIKGCTEQMPFAGLNEHLCMSAVKKIMPAAQTHLSKDGKSLAVERFDVSEEGNPLYGMEDFCSLLGYEPAQKYDPTWDRIARGSRDHVQPALQPEFFENLTKLFFLNFCLRNSDCHSKNISLIYTSKEDVKLSPIYDMLTTSVYKGYENNPPGMMFFGKRTWTPGVSIQKFVADHFFVPKKRQGEILEEICSAISSTVPEVRESMQRHPGFEDVGKRMLIAWNSGVTSLRDRKTFSLPVWKSTEEIMRISDPAPQVSKKAVMGQSEGLGVRGKYKRLDP